MVHNGQCRQALVITRAPQGPSKEAQKLPILQDPQEDPFLPPYNHLYAPLSRIPQPPTQLQPFTSATSFHYPFCPYSTSQLTPPTPAKDPFMVFLRHPQGKHYHCPFPAPGSPNNRYVCFFFYNWSLQLEDLESPFQHRPRLLNLSDSVFFNHLPTRDDANRVYTPSLLWKRGNGFRLRQLMHSLKWMH